jgi:hypothetical protein
LKKKERINAIVKMRILKNNRKLKRIQTRLMKIKTNNLNKINMRKNKRKIKVNILLQRMKSRKKKRKTKRRRNRRITHMMINYNKCLIEN